MVEFISNLIKNDVLSTLIMSFIPMIELKGGIVFARGLGLGFFSAFGIAYIGSTLAFVLVYFLLKPILALLKKIKWFKSFTLKIEGYFEERAKETLAKQQLNKKNQTKSETFIKQLSVSIFVAIPLPMTGVWMGTAIAVFLGLKFSQSILPVVLGNFIAGAIIALLAEICVRFWSIKILDYILYGLLGLALVLTILVVIKLIIQKPKKEEE